MKTKFILLLFILILLFTLSSCASKEKAPRERDETFIADIDQFVVETYPLYASFSMNNPKIYEFNFIFSPRNNYLFIRGRIGIDQVEAGFSYNERQKLIQAKNLYLKDYETNSFTKEKPSKKNAYSTGHVFFRWGSAGLTHSANTPYITNVQFIRDGKPYFRLLFEQTKEDDDSGNYSPRINVYISPAQWDQILAACNQEHLVELTDEILAQAEAF
ncbi:MAG: hypothetical protein IKR64_05920 [Treponema sp.]|nr:hypothetical protein [Treponema sp.]